MTRAEVRDHCVSLPGARETTWPGVDVPVVVANGRPFVYLHDDHVLLRAGTSASDTTDLRLAHPDDVHLVAYEGRNGWVSVTLTPTFPTPLLVTLLTHSHHLAQTHPTWLES